MAKKKNPLSSSTNTLQKFEQITTRAEALASPTSPFQRRSSMLDPSENTNINTSEFRGIFNLIAMALVWFFLIHEGRELLLRGTLLGIERLFDLFDPRTLFPAWFALVICSFGSLLLVNLIGLEFFDPRGTPIFLLQLFFHLSYAIGGSVMIWVLNLPIVQTGFLLAELAVLLMKVYSFYCVNKEAAIQHLEHKAIRAELKDLAKQTRKKNQSLPKLDIAKVDPRHRFPQSATVREFVFFLMVPTLVYEFEYPRTPSIRISYILEKIASGIGAFSCLHILVEKFIIPVLQNVATMPITDAVSHLMLPFLFTYLLVFYLVFDICCNAFAEITRFADRQFYRDWWNSTTFDEFARKWNIPVHEFLLRHVYLESIKSYKMGRTSATFVTFLFSSIVHELFMFLAFRHFSPLLFLMQMSQLPLIYIGRHPIFKGKRLGNCFFWLGMILGPPLISIIYTQRAYQFV